MTPLQLEPIAARLSLTLDWARSVQQAYGEACRDLRQLNPQGSEMFMGINRQVQLLTDLHAQLCGIVRGTSRATTESSRAPSGEELFASLCDAYSFYPGNQQIVALLRYIWTLANAESFLELAREASKPLLFVHISCQKRVHKAAASVASFGPPAADEAHLIVVGRPSQPTPGLIFDYRDGVLTIPVSDWYESHYQKTLYTYGLLTTLLDFERLFKLDDDVSMLSRKALDGAIAELRLRNCHYAGSMATCSARFSDYKGWHVNKCHDKAFERRGISIFSSGSFAMGGLGYHLSYRAARVIRDCFLANPMFYGEPRYALMEDAMVGLMLNSENIHCQNRGSAHLGFRIEDETCRTGETLRNEFELLYGRIGRMLASFPP
jgi:hypothetical protein